MANTQVEFFEAMKYSLFALSVVFGADALALARVPYELVPLYRWGARHDGRGDIKYEIVLRLAPRTRSLYLLFTISLILFRFFPL